jgi:hypothetical protein
MNARVGLLFVLVVCLSHSVVAQADNSFFFNITIAPDGFLAPIISSVNLTLPDFTFNFLGFPVDATNILCFNMSIGRIEGVILANNFSEETGSSYELLTIDAVAYDLELTCTGNYSYTILRDTYAGNMTMGMGNGTWLNIVVDANVIETNSSTTPPPAPAPPPTTNGTNTTSLLEINGFQIDPMQILAAMIPSAQIQLMKAQFSFERQIEEDTEEPVPPPTIILELSDCDMDPIITYVVTDDETLNQSEALLIEAITPEIKPLVCAQLEELVATNLTMVVNGLVSTLWLGFQSIEEKDPPDIFKEVGTFYAFLGVTLLWIVIVAFFLAFPLIRRRYLLKNKPDFYVETAPLTTQAPASSLQLELSEKEVPLIMHPKLNWFWKYSILLALLWNIALFISANISVASSVYLYLTIGNSVKRLPSLYTFMLWDSVVEMWEAGVWPLSLLIGITSGIWPYIKLIAMLMCWILPPRVLSDKYRLYLLRVLDALGKWSLIDVYVLVLFLESFRIHIQLTSAIAIDMAVEVQYAFYSYLAATMVSLILTHVFLFVNHHLVEPKIPPTKGQMLCTHHFIMFGKEITIPVLGSALVVVALLVTGVVGVLGAGVQAFQFNWEGSLIGTLLALSGGDTTDTYSVFDLVGVIPDTTFNDPGNFGIRCVQVAYVMFVFVIPMMHLISLIMLWLLPLSARMQHRFYAGVEILNAWSAMDVFLVALIVALVELETFAEFIATQSCAQIDVVLSTYFPNTGGTCFTVSATLEEGVWILATAVLLVLVVGYAVMFLCNKALMERIKVERRNSEAKLAPQPSDYDDLFAEDYFPTKSASSTHSSYNKPV